MFCYSRTTAGSSGLGCPYSCTTEVREVLWNSFPRVYNITNSEIRSAAMLNLVEEEIPGQSSLSLYS